MWQAITDSKELNYADAVLVNEHTTAAGSLDQEPDHTDLEDQCDEAYLPQSYFRLSAVPPKALEPQEEDPNESNQREKGPVAVLSHQSLNFGWNRADIAGSQLSRPNGEARTQNVQHM